jgi:uncharacterized low-complexity protein
MTGMLSDEQLAALTPSELCPHRTPIPTQAVSSDEYYPPPQNEKQREVEARMLAMADELGRKSGLDRRRFFQTASGMAVAFVAMNQVYGGLFEAHAQEAATPEQAKARADSGAHGRQRRGPGQSAGGQRRAGDGQHSAGAESASFPQLVRQQRHHQAASRSLVPVPCQDRALG